MHPNLQFVLIALAIFAVYYVYWVLRTRVEASKLKYIREHGQPYEGILYNIDTNMHLMGNRYRLFVRIDTPEGEKKLTNFPKVRGTPYGVGMQVPVYYCPEYAGEFIFEDDRVRLMDHPLSVIRKDAIVPRMFALYTVVVWVVCALFIFFGLRFFGVP